MANDIAKRPAAPLPAAAPSPYRKFADQRQTPNFVGQLLRFDGKQGRYTVGTEKKEVKEGTLLVAGMFTLKYGWVKWVGGKLIRSEMRLVDEGFELPPRDSMGDLDDQEWETIGKGKDEVPRDPWQETCTLVLANPDNRDLYTFSTNSQGGRDALRKLAGEYEDHQVQHGDNQIPIVALQKTFYDSNYGGVTFNPDFVIVDWNDRDAVTMTGRSNEEDGAAATPRKTAKITPLPRGKKNGGNKPRSRF